MVATSPAGQNPSEICGGDGLLPPNESPEMTGRPMRVFHRPIISELTINSFEWTVVRQARRTLLLPRHSWIEARYSHTPISV